MKKRDPVEAFFDSRNGPDRRVKKERRVSARLPRKITLFAVGMTILTIILHIIAPW